MNLQNSFAGSEADEEVFTGADEGIDIWGIEPGDDFEDDEGDTSITGIFCPSVGTAAVLFP